MSTFTPISPELLALASPAERKAYEYAAKKALALDSPLDLMMSIVPGTKDYTHSRYVSTRIANLPPNGKLIIMMHPRVGKSFIVSEGTPAWVMANNKNLSIIHATYGGDFTAGKFGRPLRSLIVRNPNVLPRLDPSAKSISYFAVHPNDGKGDYLATGVGGEATGRPADWLIMDDLIKNAEEAKSQKIRDNTWDWLTDDALMRLEPGGRAILMGTPRHEDDVIHRAMASGEWEVIRLPALAEDDDLLGREVGEALCPERYDVPALEIIRNRRPQTFATQYQLRPAPVDGDIFKKKHIVRYKKLPEKGFRFATVDLAHSTKQRADYSVIMCFFVSKPPNPRLYVTHVFREKIDSGEHIEWFDRCMASIVVGERPTYAGVEDKTFGSTMLSTARRYGRAGKVPLRPLEADTDKVTRAQTATTLGSQGLLMFPEDDVAPWMPDLEHELLLFDNGKHDDQVDTLSYGAIEFSKFPHRPPPAEPKPPKTPSEKARAQVAARKKKSSSRATRIGLMK